MNLSSVIIINGPNLNLLGKRQPEIYGKTSFEEYLVSLRTKFSDIEVEYFQSNHEGLLIDCLHEVGFTDIGIILNAGGYTHTSISLADAVASIDAPVVEVHISDIYARESFRKHSYLKEVAVHSIVGKGLAGYDEGIDYLLNR